MSGGREVRGGGCERGEWKGEEVSGGREVRGGGCEG